ncbi:hypothetical protein, partial [Pseudomonas aeruginosa]
VFAILSISSTALWMISAPAPSPQRVRRTLPPAQGSRLKAA